ncbi:CAAX protease self-immunity [Marivirga sericea]|uniref:CAAX protease self-immunity n=1 Tax=Marivirga sericea TaxID=1028 RepID=A0A1X7JAF7_9BACT|nr:CAAX protease self-immunity [Marivirga sericea]
MFFIFGIGLAYILLKLLSKSIKIPSTLFLIIISAILFSLLHLNVIGKQDNFLAYLIILIPYFIKGYFYGYINYRLGFRYAFYAHALHNLTLASMNLMMR